MDGFFNEDRSYLFTAFNSTVLSATSAEHLSCTNDSPIPYTRKILVPSAAFALLRNFGSTPFSNIGANSRGGEGGGVGDLRLSLGLGLGLS